MSTWKKSTPGSLRLGGQERPPGLPGSPGRGVDARVLEDLPGCRRRELMTQAGQLAVDAPAAPAKKRLRLAVQDAEHTGGTETRTNWLDLLVLR